MTDITELAQSLKAAAEKATQGNWRAFQYHDGRCGIGGGHNDEIMVCEHISKERPHDAVFIALANPVNVLALVGALEEAQQYAKERDEENQDLMLTIGRFRVEREGLEAIRAAAEKLVRCKGRYHSEQNYRALAALFGVTTPDLPPLDNESRTVTVKQGEVLVTVAGFTGCGKSAIAGEIEIAMKAIGVPVTWANGDSEKRMTGADWLTAIEMHKPTVRIVEVNIPRAEGHQSRG
ncbi:TPA: ead/Ea22-like family protein [Klebsiella pneumoniae]|nr:ead/Ea22-like family protein [Klebsiella pneumoniae subsp. pneumoniae]HBX6193591.1 ead/Ea22-like family protein [Klebsiella pneumoniae]HCE8918865.1 ead/Ea22-like family protein [Klebsiella pneumoniae]